MIPPSQSRSWYLYLSLFTFHPFVVLNVFSTQHTPSYARNHIYTHTRVKFEEIAWLIQRRHSHTPHQTLSARAHLVPSSLNGVKSGCLCLFRRGSSISTYLCAQVRPVPHLLHVCARACVHVYLHWWTERQRLIVWVFIHTNMQPDDTFLWAIFTLGTCCLVCAADYYLFQPPPPPPPVAIMKWLCCVFTFSMEMETLVAGDLDATSSVIICRRILTNMPYLPPSPKPVTWEDVVLELCWLFAVVWSLMEVTAAIRLKA